MPSATRPAPPTPTAPPITVVVADDHPLYRDGIVRALQAHGGFEVVGATSDGQSALELIRDLEPDVALLDVRMPRMDGIEVVAALADRGPDVPVVLLSAFTGTPLRLSGLAAGAAAFVHKTAERQLICQTLLDVARARHQSPRHRATRAAAHSVGPRGSRA